jgi:hypothetical protein
MTKTTPTIYRRAVCAHTDATEQLHCPKCLGTGFAWPELRVLTLWQPWASLMAWGDKTVETRHGAFPKYLGWVAIQAAATALKPNEIDVINESYTQRVMARERVQPNTLERGKILCVVRFTEYETTAPAGWRFTRPRWPGCASRSRGRARRASSARQRAFAGRLLAN